MTRLLMMVIALLAVRSASAWTTLPARTNDVPGFVYTQSASDWRDINIYHVMTDRFFNGDPSNDTANPRGTVDYTNFDALHGGDFKGVQAKLDYLKMLGVRAILLAPVVHNTWGAYQGYGAGDFNQIDPHWGTLAELRSLIDAAHARGMYVFIDMVVNHMADLIDSADAGFPTYRDAEYTPKWKFPDPRHVAPFDTFDKFYMHGEISNWNDDVNVVLGDYPGLDSLRTTNAQVRADFVTIYKALIAATDCDGFRADTARHVEMGFWDTFLPALTNLTGKTNFFVFCEATKGSEPELGPYTQSNRFNSAINFPFNGTISAVFKDFGSTGRLTYHTLPAQLTNYSARARNQLVNFLDSHDEIRWANQLSNDVARLKVAYTYLLTTIEVPYVYYGTEQGFNGGDDPYNREDMFAGGFEPGASVGDNFNYTHPLFLHLRKLNLLRNALTPLRRGGYVERWSTWSTGGPGGPGLYAFSRTNGTDEVLVILNTTNITRTATIPVGFSNGTQLFNQLDTDTVAVAGSAVAVNLPANGGKIFYPSIPVLPASVISNVPAHSATGVFPTNAITLWFDKPMTHATTEAGFSLAVPGTFAWLDGDTRMVFTPNQPLGANTRYTMTQNLDAAFVTFFDTSGYSAMSVAGTFNGWNPAANNMTFIAPHLWQFDTTFNNASGVEFKFAANSSWAINWGGASMTGTGVYYGGNIVVPGTLNGAYRFQFNDQTFAYSLNVLSPPSVVSVTPANGAYNIGLSTNVAVTFDKPMDKPSTQAAFSLGAAGTFAWFDGDTRLVFTASLAPHTTYTVSISTGATGTNGQALVAAFSSTFDTGGGYSNMTVAGTFNGFNPAANNIMQLAGKNLWQYDTNFVNATGVQFKFAADGNWNVNWGDNNQSQFTVPMTGIGENFGSNIVVNSTLNGAYRFTLNDQTGAYALTVADTDGNGLPDSWEQLYFGHLGVNPSADADGDGLTNLQEYQAGTSPTDAGNALRILAVQRTGNNLAITFSTATGKQYFIEQRTNLTTGAWSALPGTIAGSGAPQSVTATNAIGCYRVRLAP